MADGRRRDQQSGAGRGVEHDAGTAGGNVVRRPGVGFRVAVAAAGGAVGARCADGPAGPVRRGGLAAAAGRGGRDYTTPAALAVSRAKERLAEAMLADSTEQGVSANTIADRARNAQSRPTTLKILAAELLRHDVSQALRPLLEADAPLYVSRGLDRTVMLGSMWEDEPEEARLRHLADAKRALDASRLQLHDTKTGEVADIRRLVADDAGRLEVRRVT